MTSVDDVVRALIVVDVQVDFCEGGALAVKGGNAVAQGVADYIYSSNVEYRAVIATKDWHIDPGEHFSATPDFVDSWPVHCEAESFGAELHSALATVSFDAIITKGEYTAAYSGFDGATIFGDSLEQLLIDLEIEAVDIVGLAYDYCVRSTALDAVSRGFEVRVFTDLTEAVHNFPEALIAQDEELAEAGIQVIHSSEAA